MKVKVEKFGSKAIGVTITGDKKNVEPQHFLVKLPFGEVEITRTTDDNYWVHVNTKVNPVTEEPCGVLSKLRVDGVGDNSVYIPNVSANHMAILLTKGGSK